MKMHTKTTAADPDRDPPILILVKSDGKKQLPPPVPGRQAGRWADGWLAEDWQVYFDERAGIAEFVGGLSRREAEAQAFSCCVTEWMNRHPEISSPDHCVACGGSDSAYEPLLPFGVELDGHTWLHSPCWQGWCDGRKSNAASALEKMGLERGNPTYDK